MKQRYSTKQEALIVNYLMKNSEKHFTADEIWAAMMSYGVSRATVYRRLERLVEDGAIIKFNFGAGIGACYQYCGERHEDKGYHFVCTRCKCVQHLDCAVMRGVDEHLNGEHGLKIDNSRTVLYGLCGRCLEC